MFLEIFRDNQPTAVAVEATDHAVHPRGGTDSVLSYSCRRCSRCRLHQQNLMVATYTNRMRRSCRWDEADPVLTLSRLESALSVCSCMVPARLCRAASSVDLLLCALAPAEKSVYIPRRCWLRSSGEGCFAKSAACQGIGAVLTTGSLHLDKLRRRCIDSISGRA